MAQKSNVQIVDPRDICSRDVLFRYSILFGFALFFLGMLFILLVASIAEQSTNVSISRIFELMIAWFALILIFGPALGMFHWRIQLRTYSRRRVAILGGILGFTGFPWLLASVVTCYELAKRHLAIVWMEPIWACLVTCVGIFITWNLIAIAGWPIIIRVRPFRLQDGASCPQCGYCVRGVTSQICPECGESFDESELGLTTSQFEQLINGNTNVVH